MLTGKHANRQSMRIDKACEQTKHANRQSMQTDMKIDKLEQTQNRPLHFTSNKGGGKKFIKKAEW